MKEKKLETAEPEETFVPRDTIEAIPEAPTPIPEAPKPVKTVVFTSRHKAFAFEFPPGRIIQFISNGYVGVFATNKKEQLEGIRKHPEFGVEIHELADGQRAPGKPSNVIFGPRSALSAQQLADQLDPQVKQIIIDSNIAARRRAEGE